VPGLTLAGLSGRSGFLFPMLLIRGPFRFGLRLSAKLILRDVQGFVSYGVASNRTSVRPLTRLPLAWILCACENDGHDQDRL
jgi:hypothetical protein